MRGNPRIQAWLHAVAIASLITLILLCLAWESWLAPLKPGGSLLVLKAVPLLAPLPGVLQGRRRTLQWSSLLILPWFTEGVVRAWSDAGPAALLAFAEALLSVLFFVAVIFLARARPGARARL